MAPHVSLALSRREFLGGRVVGEVGGDRESELRKQ
jgi:hypothetical protein